VTALVCSLDSSKFQIRHARQRQAFFIARSREGLRPSQGADLGRRSAPFTRPAFDQGDAVPRRLSSSKKGQAPGEERVSAAVDFKFASSPKYFKRFGHDRLLQRGKIERRRSTTADDAPRRHRVAIINLSMSIGRGTILPLSIRFGRPPHISVDRGRTWMTIVGACV